MQKKKNFSDTKKKKNLKKKNQKNEKIQNSKKSEEKFSLFSKIFDERISIFDLSIK